MKTFLKGLIRIVKILIWPIIILIGYLIYRKKPTFAEIHGTIENPNKKDDNEKGDKILSSVDIVRKRMQRKKKK